MKRFILMVSISIIALTVTAYTPRHEAILEFYMPYFLRMIDTTTNDTTFVKAGYVESPYANFTDSLECPRAKLDTIQLTGTHRMFVTTDIDAYLWNIVTPRGDTITFEFPKIGSNTSRLYWVFDPPNDFIIKDQSGGGIFAIDTNTLHSDYYIDYGSISDRGKRAYIDTLLPEKIRMNNGAIITNPPGTLDVDVNAANMTINAKVGILSSNLPKALNVKGNTAWFNSSAENIFNMQIATYDMNFESPTSVPDGTLFSFNFSGTGDREFAMYKKGSTVFRTWDGSSTVIPRITITGNVAKAVVDIDDANVNVNDGNLLVTGEIKGSRQNFGAGENTARSDDAWMRVYNGVTMSATIGYVMPRAGSIVGVSMLVNCTNYSAIGTAEIEVYKNGVNVFSKVASVTGTGIIKAYDTQARGIDTFVAGNVISLKYDKVSGTFTLDDFICFVEVVFDD